MTNTLPFSDVVAAEVRSWLGRRNLKQKDLAEAMGIDQSGVSERINGKTDFTLDELPAVARFLGVPVEELMRSPIAMTGYRARRAHRESIVPRWGAVVLPFERRRSA